MLQLLAAIVWEVHFQLSLKGGFLHPSWDEDPYGRSDYVAFFHYTCDEVSSLPREK